VPGVGKTHLFGPVGSRQPLRVPSIRTRGVCRKASFKWAFFRFSWGQCAHFPRCGLFFHWAEVAWEDVFCRISPVKSRSRQLDE
jgi:hypothetical protein